MKRSAKIISQSFSALIIFSVSFSVVANCNINILKTTPLVRFNLSTDGTVYDTWTKLTWKQCVEGKFSDGANGCSADIATTFTWQNALLHAVAVNNGDATLNLSYTDWRVPNIKELESIVERHCEDPSINLTIFPDTTIGSYWSSTPYLSNGNATIPQSIWHVSFKTGSVVTNSAVSSYTYLRLVRDGL